MALAAPKNVRKVTVRCCANCAYRFIEDDEMYCRRDEDYAPWGDEVDIHFTVCDGYKRIESKKKGK